MRNDWRDFGRDAKPWQPWPGTVSNLWWFVGGSNACKGDGGGKQSTFFRGFFTNTPHWKLWQPFYAQTTLQFRLRLRLDAHQQYSWQELVPLNSQCGNVEGTPHAAFGRLTELTISFTLVSWQKKVSAFPARKSLADYLNGITLWGTLVFNLKICLPSTRYHVPKCGADGPVPGGTMPKVSREGDLPPMRHTEVISYSKMVTYGFFFQKAVACFCLTLDLVDFGILMEMLVLPT